MFHFLRDMSRIETGNTQVAATRASAAPAWRVLIMASAMGASVLAVEAAHASTPSPLPTSWEVSGEFDDGSQPSGGNPSGVWSYGYETTLGGAFTLLTQHLPATSPFDPAGGNVLGWIGADGDPSILHNVNMQPWTTPSSYPYPDTLAARAVSLSPGSKCEFAVVRFTAPYAATYKISGQFYGQDANQVGNLHGRTKGYLLQNNSLLYTGSLYAIGGQFAANFTSKTTHPLNAGDTIDFAVGCGPQNDYVFGGTGLHAVIQKR